MSSEIPEMKSSYLSQKKETAMQQFESAVEEYKKIMSDKILPDNQTLSYEKNLKSILNRLLVSADNLDTEKPGSGIFGLIVLLLRMNLKLKDKNNELDSRMRDLERKVSKTEMR